MPRINKDDPRRQGGPYRYVTKHGLGPGTLPRDVDLVKWEDLPNYKTAIWLDRWLTDEELKKYDIYPEHIQEGMEPVSEGAAADDPRRKYGPYKYVVKHGLGPGMLPKDVEIVKYEDLPNGKTAIWLDRFLTTKELKEYDIPSETTLSEGKACVYESLTDDELGRLANLPLSEDDMGTMLGLFELLKEDEESKTKAIETIEALFAGKKLVPADSEETTTVITDTTTELPPTPKQISERYVRTLLGEDRTRC